MEKIKEGSIDKEIPQLPKKKKNLFKRILTIILYLFIVLISINSLLYVLLSIPYVQQKVLAFAVDKVKEITKTDIRIESVHLRLFNNVALSGIYVEDLDKDTLVYAKDLGVSLSPMELFKGKLQINIIDLNDFTIKVSQKTPDSDFNFQFLIDAFASDTTTVEDTTSSSLKIAIEDITLKNGRITYDVLSEPATPDEFNASHIHINELNSVIHLPSIDLSNLDVTLASLSFKEQSGLIIKNLKGKITSDRFDLFAQDFELSLPNSILKIPTGQYNLLTDSFHLESGESILSPQDLLVFMPDLKFLTQNFNLKTTIEGKLPVINITNFVANYGEDLKLDATASMSDYANYGIANLNLDITNFLITPRGILEFAQLGDSTFESPDILEALGTIRLSGTLNGSLSSFNLDAESWVKQGSIQMIANGSLDTTFTNFDVKAKLQTQNFKLGNLLENPDLGAISINMDLGASQSDKKSLNADVKGVVRNVQYDKQNLDNIPFTAYYNAQKMGAWLKADLPEGKVDATVDMTQAKIPKTTLDLKLQNLLLDKFAEFPDWKDPVLSFNLNADILGLDINTMQGAFALEELKFSHDSVSFYPGKITLDLQNNGENNSLIKLGSSFFDAQIDGKYDFLTLYDEFNNFINQYLPSLFPVSKKKRKQPTNNNFKFSALIHNTEQLEKVFDLPFNIMKPVVLNGFLNSANNQFSAVGNMADVRFGESVIKNTKLDIQNNDSTLALKLNSKLINGENILSFVYDADIVSDTISNYLNILSDTTSLNMNATFKALAHFSYDSKDSLVSFVQFKPTDINIGKLDLHFMPAKIINNRDKTSISNFGFTVGKGRSFSRFLGIDGSLSRSPQDTLNINFTNAQIADILEVFDVNNISTIINGNIKLVNLLKTPEMYTNNFQLNDILVFNDTLGDLKVYSKWNDAEGAIGFFSTLGRGETLSKTSGWVYPTQDSLNLKINLNKFSLNWMEPFMAGILNKISGSISTELTAKGRISSPDIRGWLGVNNTYLGVDYTNVTYHIEDTISITPDKIGFDNLIVKDNYNNTANVSAVVTHKNFNNINYNIDATLRNLLVLNTMSRIDSLFYGKVFANGTANIRGNDENINITMNVRNGKDSRVNIRIPESQVATDYASVVYINTPVEAGVPVVGTVDKTETLPLKLAVDLNVNNDIALGVIINPLTGDAMEIKGSGLIKFNYDMQSEAMNAFGNYIISSGYVKLKLQNIATMMFQIQDGSKLIMNGDPLKTNFDITAYKRVKADLTTLDPSFSVEGTSKVVVDCVLGITGNMDKMSLTYNIRLPDAPEDMQQKVKSLVTTDEQRTRQFAYLLVTGSFYSGGGGTGGNIADGLLTNIASGAMSSALNALFGNMLGSKWQVGTKISSNDGTFSDMDMSVSVSRSFMDDRLTFNTNLGYRTDQSLPTSNAFIGDFDVDYALTRSIKLKVFNKTNDQLYKQAPTTQGVGIVYTKEAKKFKDLFKVFRKKRKSRVVEQSTTDSK